MIKFPKIIIELGLSKIDGIGVFSAKDVIKNEIVAEGINEEDYKSLITWESIKFFDEDLKQKIYSYCIGTPEGFFPPENNDFNELSIEWYMNHSCNGNIGFNNNGDFIALRNIKKNEELNYDYALAESNPKFRMHCKCGAKNCRKIITGNDWRSSNFWEIHHKHMFPLLREPEKVF